MIFHILPWFSIFHRGFSMVFLYFLRDFPCFMIVLVVLFNRQAARNGGQEPATHGDSALWCARRGKVEGREEGKPLNIHLVGGLELLFPYIGNNNPIWLN
jgi:hypothetical protein